MEISDFTYRLSKRFEGSNDIVISDLESWAVRNKIQPSDLDNLYESIIENYAYKTFPAIAVINKLYLSRNLSEGYRNQKDYKNCLERTVDQDIKTIIHSLKKIRNKQLNNTPLSNLEMDFTETWEDIYYFWSVLINEKKYNESQAERYCEKIKQKIASGEVPSYDIKDSIQVEATITNWAGCKKIDKTDYFHD